MKPKKYKKQPNALLWMGGTFAVLIGLMLFATMGKPEVKIEQPKDNHSYSDEMLHDFWDSELKKLIEGQLVNTKLPYEEINLRYKELNNKIVARTSKAIDFELITKYSRWGKGAFASAGVNETNNNSVEIDLFIPSLLDSFENLHGSSLPDWHEVFDTHVLIIIMHEMEHAGELAGRVDPHVQQVDIAEESRAWAETCRHTITPLVEKYHLRIGNTEGKLYQAWNDTHGDTNSLAWRQAMQNSYGSIASK